tara:strand:- start:3245 stop:3706 length:462 start_codon:yes stop_codon:yes gene_type:complete
MVAITVVLAGVLYVWASSLAGDSTGDTLDTYVFTAEDANPNADPTTDVDPLVRVGMQSGSGLNWGTLQVTIKIDGGTPMTCKDASTADDDASCTYEKYGDSGNAQNWEVGEGITISEGSADDCTASCNVEVTLIKQGAGDTEDKTLGVVSSSA